MNDSNGEQLGDLALIGAVGFLLLTPLALIYGLLKGGKLIKFNFVLFSDPNTTHTTPPLDGIQAEIFREGLRKWVRKDKILKSSIEEVKTSG